MRAPAADPAWSEFVAWCRARGLRALPAHPWTVAAYLRWCERRLSHRAVLARVRVIARAHALACLAAPERHPTVERTLCAIAVRDRLRPSRSGLFAVDPTEGRQAATDADTLTTGAGAPADRPSPPAAGRRGMRAAPPLVRRRPEAHDR